MEPVAPLSLQGDRAGWTRYFFYLEQHSCSVLTRKAIRNSAFQIWSSPWPILQYMTSCEGSSTALENTAPPTKPCSSRPAGPGRFLRFPTGQDRATYCSETRWMASTRQVRAQERDECQPLEHDSRAGSRSCMRPRRNVCLRRQAAHAGGTTELQVARPPMQTSDDAFACLHLSGPPS